MSENVPSRVRLTFGAKDFDQAKYNRVASRARLSDVHLSATTYKIDVSYFLASESGPDLKPSFSGKPADQILDAEEGILFGRYIWSAEIKATRKKALSLRCEYVVVYSNLVGEDEDYCFLYFDKLARFTTYPYFRSVFSILLANSGVVFPPLPSLTDRMD